jgi:NADPH:quinone reductase-like Zn-dependent oxidoreductase
VAREGDEPAGGQTVASPVTCPLVPDLDGVAGSEFAGLVDEVGAAVTEFRVGDEVFSIKGGANAEYVTVGESAAIAQ